MISDTVRPIVLGADVSAARTTWLVRAMSTCRRGQAKIPTRRRPRILGAVLVPRVLAPSLRTATARQGGNPAPTSDAPVWSRAQAINDHGQVVGTRTDRASSVLWADGVTIELGAFPVGEWNEANAINAAGLIAGWGGVQGPYDMHALLWQDREIRDLGFPPGRRWSAANGSNASGQVVGEAGTDPAGDARATVWADGVIEELGTLPGDPESWALAINGGGDIVGWSRNDDEVRRAVVWDRGRIVALPAPGDTISGASAINAAGQSVGWSGTPDRGSRAVVWQDGAVSALETLSGHPQSDAVAINASGQIVGSASTVHRTSHAVRWATSRPSS